MLAKINKMACNSIYCSAPSITWFPSLKYLYYMVARPPPTKDLQGTMVYKAMQSLPRTQQEHLTTNCLASSSDPFILHGCSILTKQSIFRSMWLSLRIIYISIKTVYLDPKAIVQLYIYLDYIFVLIK